MGLALTCHCLLKPIYHDPIWQDFEGNQGKGGWQDSKAPKFSKNKEGASNLSNLNFLGKRVMPSTGDNNSPVDLGLNWLGHIGR